MGNKASAKVKKFKNSVIPPDHAFMIEIIGSEGKDESHTEYLIKISTWPTS
jgi:hypothetical protein